MPPAAAKWVCSSCSTLLMIAAPGPSPSPCCCCPPAAAAAAAAASECAPAAASPPAAGLAPPPPASDRQRYLSSDSWVASATALTCSRSASVDAAACGAAVRSHTPRQYCSAGIRSDWCFWVPPWLRMVASRPIMRKSDSKEGSPPAGQKGGKSRGWGGGGGGWVGAGHATQNKKAALPALRATKAAGLHAALNPSWPSTGPPGTARLLLACRSKDVHQCTQQLLDCLAAQLTGQDLQAGSHKAQQGC